MVASYVEPAPRLAFYRRILQTPAAYTVLAPILLLTGSTTTILAPMILLPAAFLNFSLLMGFFQFLCTFDLGLARLVDRHFATRNGASDGLAKDIIAARILIALTLMGAVLCVAPWIGFSYVLAGVGGVSFMAAVGPIALHRARSNVFAFTVTALMVQLGLGPPRLGGLIFGGVLGCMVAMAIWYGGLAIALNASYLRGFRPRSMGSAARLYAMALPLFAYDTFWSLYLLTPRWFGVLLNTATEAGLFSFGANLIWIGAGVVVLIVQVYYPRHLVNRDQRALIREMFALLALSTAAIMVLAIPLCRYELAIVFPKFAAADASTAAMLVSGIPVALTCWVLPLLIATSDHPWSESAIAFGGSSVGLMGLMAFGEHYDGIRGQAWGCVVSAAAVFTIVSFLIGKRGLLKPSSTVVLLCLLALAVVGCAWEWHFFFGSFGV